MSGFHNKNLQLAPQTHFARMNWWLHHNISSKKYFLDPLETRTKWQRLQVTVPALPAQLFSTCLLTAFQRTLNSIPITRVLTYGYDSLPDNALRDHLHSIFCLGDHTCYDLLNRMPQRLKVLVWRGDAIFGVSNNIAIQKRHIILLGAYLKQPRLQLGHHLISCLSEFWLSKWERGRC